MKKLLLVLFLTLFPVLAHGATYYVAKTGSNSNSCKQAKKPVTAKQTINAGISCLQGGDTLIVKSGMYNESVRNNIPPGSPNAPTVVKSEVQYGAILQPIGRNDIRIVSFGEGVNQHWITFDGFVLDGSNAGAPTTGLRVTGESGTDDILFINNEIRNLVGTNTMNPSVGISFGYDPKNVIIRGNKIHDIGRGDTTAGPGWSYGLYTGGHLIFENNEVYNTTGYGLHGYSSSGRIDNMIIRSNYFHDTGGPAILACHSNNQVYNNIVVRAGIGPAFQRNAIQISGSCAGQVSSNNVVSNNTIYQSGGHCIDLGYSSNNTVRNNICYHNDHDAVGVGSGTGNTIDHHYTSAPQFVNVPFDFRLQAGSPGKNASDQGGEVGAYGNDNTCVGPGCAGNSGGQGKPR
jgi:parallel beta-helix repeat protein